MKRVLALLLCLVMVFSLAACGGNTDKPDETKKPSVETPADKPTTGENEGDGDTTETIRPNGELPANERKLTEAEKRHYVGVVMNAALTLDIDTLREYAKNEEDLENYQKIADDPVMKEWYLKTIGKSVYLESVGKIAYPEPEAVFQMYQTHFLRTNDVPPEDVTKLSLEELSAIYEQYKDNIPYVIEDVNPEYDCPIYLQDGRIYFELDELLSCTSYCYDTDDLVPSGYSWEGEYKHIAAYIFGYDADEITDFSELLADGAFDYVMPILDNDLNAMVEYFDGLKEEHDWNATPGEDDFYEKYYQAYYKNDAFRAKIEAWMKENVFCGFSGHGFDVWYIVNQDEFYQTYEMSAADKALIKDLPICGWNYCSTYSSADGVFGAYYDFVNAMIEGGLLEDVV